MPEVRSTPVVRKSGLLHHARGAGKGRARTGLLALTAAAALLVPTVPARSASTPNGQWVTPQGSSAGTANGDYLSSNSPDGLDEPYRYFVEVPPGLSRLVIELFDADLGAGGGTEDTAGRDRDRAGGFDGEATYTLVHPSGATRNVRFTTGNATGPTGADNSWLALFDSTGDTVRDEFGAVSYANNDGAVDWAGNWTEVSDNSNPASGDLMISGGELLIQDGANYIYRQADLAGDGFSTATLTFDFRTVNVESSDTVRVDVSGNGGSSWVTLDTFAGAGSGSRSYNISAYIAANTRIRFIRTAGYSGNDEFRIDDVQIRETSIDAGHWELRVDQSDGGGDEINALGIRAHDGTSGAGGTELNVYYDSHNQYGVNPTGSASGANSRSYDYYPYITSGCTAAKNDFDYDSNSGNAGSQVFRSRTGAFTQTFTSGSLSSNDSWRRDTINRWTTDTASTDYGVWSLDATINTYFTPAVNGNYANLYVSNFQAAANPPAANPTANAFRVYLPTDAGAAPVKPYLEQLLTHKSGTNPVLAGQTSRWQVTIRL
ncbi:MAG TPA: hypothetical protein VEL74_20305, partial [Thermoanaerobaculia bacterium]|nr:hypothetical protein [Thermoanaerobaculia bacterium]